MIEINELHFWESVYLKRDIVSFRNEDLNNELSISTTEVISKQFCTLEMINKEILLERYLWTVTWLDGRI